MFLKVEKDLNSHTQSNSLSLSGTIVPHLLSEDSLNNLNSLGTTTTLLTGSSVLYRTYGIRYWSTLMQGPRCNGSHSRKSNKMSRYYYVTMKALLFPVQSSLVLNAFLSRTCCGMLRLFQSFYDSVINLHKHRSLSAWPQVNTAFPRRNK